MKKTFVVALALLLALVWAAPEAQARDRHRERGRGRCRDPFGEAVWRVRMIPRIILDGHRAEMEDREDEWRFREPERVRLVPEAPDPREVFTRDGRLNNNTNMDIVVFVDDVRIGRLAAGEYVPLSDMPDGNITFYPAPEAGKEGQ